MWTGGYAGRDSRYPLSSTITSSTRSDNAFHPSTWALTSIYSSTTNDLIMPYIQAALAHMYSSILVLCSVWMSATVLRRIVLAFSRKEGVLPPGPKRHLLFGNTFDVPKEYPWKKWAEWSKIYGCAVVTSERSSSLIRVLRRHHIPGDFRQSHSCSQFVQRSERALEQTPDIL